MMVRKEIVLVVYTFALKIKLGHNDFDLEDIKSEHKIS